MGHARLAARVSRLLFARPSCTLRYVNEHEPTATQSRYLDAIMARPGMSYRQLQDAMGTESVSGTYEMVARLRRYGYVEDARGAGIRLAGGEER